MCKFAGFKGRTNVTSLSLQPFPFSALQFSGNSPSRDRLHCTPLRVSEHRSAMSEGSHPLLSGAFGTLSMLIWIGVYFPQLLKSYRSKSVDGVSVGWLILWILGDATNLSGMRQGALHASTCWVSSSVAQLRGCLRNIPRTWYSPRAVQSAQEPLCSPCTIFWSSLPLQCKLSQSEVSAALGATSDAAHAPCVRHAHVWPQERRLRRPWCRPAQRRRRCAW